jgi:hypothetical protein
MGEVPFATTPEDSWPRTCQEVGLRPLSMRTSLVVLPSVLLRQSEQYGLYEDSEHQSHIFLYINNQCQRVLEKRF